MSEISRQVNILIIHVLYHFISPCNGKEGNFSKIYERVNCERVDSTNRKSDNFRTINRSIESVSVNQMHYKSA